MTRRVDNVSKIAQGNALRNNLALQRGLDRSFRAGRLPSDVHALAQGLLIRAERMIKSSPRNYAGMDCWYMSSPERGVVMRWLYGGGSLGEIAEKVFRFPPVGPAWNLTWSLRDIATAVGLGAHVMDCEGYFNKLQAIYDKVNKLTHNVPVNELADAVQQAIATRSGQAGLPPAPPGLGPWPFLIAAGIGFVVLRDVSHGYGEGMARKRKRTRLAQGKDLGA